MLSTIISYTKAHTDIWKRPFGDLHVTSRSSDTNKLQKLVKDYYSQVCVKVHRKSYLCVLLNESHLTNQHIEIVRMFLDSEFFITELSVLAFFIRGTTEGFPMDSLEQYLVKYRHIVVSPPTNETETLLLEPMCLNASKSMLQCGREYGFTDKNEPARATQLNLLTAEELNQLPTNNIPSERILSAFDRKAVAAKSRNHIFKAKSIRNDMTLYQWSVSNIPVKSY